MSKTNPKIGFVSLGCPKATVDSEHILTRLRAEGYKVSGFYPKLLNPLPAQQFEDFGASCKRLLLPEVNFQGQLAHFVRAETSLRPESYTICGGMPFTPEMIVNKVREILA